MEVILLQRIAKLGQMGDKVRVKNGYARNFLLPTGKALRATEANRKRFEEQRTELETRNLELKSEASAVAEKLNGQSFTIIRQAGETGHLYGSVSARDIAETITAGGFKAAREQIVLRTPIKTIGLHSDSRPSPSGGREHDHRQCRPLAGRGRAPRQGRGAHRRGRDVDAGSRARSRCRACRSRRRRGLSVGFTRSRCASRQRRPACLEGGGSKRREVQIPTRHVGKIFARCGLRDASAVHRNFSPS